MASLDSFKCRKTLTVGAKTYEYLLARKRREKRPRRACRSCRSRSRSCSRICCATRTDGPSPRRTSRRSRPGSHNRGKNGARDRLPPGPRADAGFHRRARRRRSRRHARRDDRARRRSEQDQSARSGRSRHRPFGGRRLFRHLEVARPERGARIRAEPGALPLPEVGPAGLLEFLGRAARHRHLPSGQPRISRADGMDLEGEARRQDGRGRLSGYAGRHRQPHHDGQRPRRARLGRRRHRGGGGDARPAVVDAASGGDRLQACTANCARASPRPTSC